MKLIIKTMRTIQQLKNFARKELGLSDDYVRKFGPLTRKAIWQKAIDSYQEEEAIATQETTNFVPPAPSPPSTPMPAEEPEPEEKKETVAIASLEKKPAKVKVNVIGRLIRCKTIVTKKGDDMAFFKIEDKTGLVDVIVFPKVYSKFHHLLKPKSLLLIAAQIEKRSDGVRLLADEIEPRAELPDPISTAESEFVQMLGRAAEAPIIDRSIAPAIYQRLPSNYYSDDYCLPDNLIGVPRLIAKYLSDNFNWHLEKDNSHLKSSSIKHYINPDVIEGVKILYTSGLYSETDKIKQYSAIVLFRTGETCYFSRLFTWGSLSNYNPNNNLKLIARQYLRDTIKTFVANVKLIQKVGRSYQN